MKKSVEVLVWVGLGLLLLVMFRQLWESSSDPHWGCFVVCPIIVCLVIVASLYSLRDVVRSVWFRIVGFLVLFVFGTWIYYLAPVDKCVKKLHVNNSTKTIDNRSEKQPCIDAWLGSYPVQRCLAASNRAVAAFFRSQGGLEDIKNNPRIYFWYCVFQLLVVWYLVVLAFSYLGRDSFNVFGNVVSVYRK